MNESDDFFAKVIAKFPDHDKEVIAEIIEMLNANDKQDHYNAVIVLIDKMLQELSEQGLNHGLDFLSGAERLGLEEEINKLVSKLKQEGKNVDSEDVVKYLIQMIHKKFREKYDDVLAEKTDEMFITKEQKRANKEHKKHILMMMVYEFYKFVNPNAIAGETRLENFINNVVFGGLDYAMKHESKNFSIDKKFADALGDLHKDFHKQVGERGVSKGGGGLSM